MIARIAPTAVFSPNPMKNFTDFAPARAKRKCRIASASISGVLAMLAIVITWKALQPPDPRPIHYVMTVFGWTFFAAVSYALAKWCGRLTIAEAQAHRFMRDGD